jgi:hypothetical protein
MEKGLQRCLLDGVFGQGIVTEEPSAELERHGTMAAH